MAEKRKLPARERREPAAKRRASEATPQQTPQTQSSNKKKAATPPPPPEPAVVAPPLPIKIKDGDALPTVPTPQQVASLSDKDYQSIAERYSPVESELLYAAGKLTGLVFTVRCFSRLSNDRRKNG